jgi:hypothetical protein
MNWLQYTPAVQALLTTEAQITLQAFLLQLYYASHHFTDTCTHHQPVRPVSMASQYITTTSLLACLQ